MSTVRQLGTWLCVAAVATACAGDGGSHRARPSATTSPNNATASATGVRGTVSARPTCPHEPIDGTGCSPAPLSARISATTSAGAQVASTTSDAQGRYALSLPPGGYVLVVTVSRSRPRCPRTPVTVATGRVMVVDISCDTGLR